MSRRFGIMRDRSAELNAVPGTRLYCTLFDAITAAEYVRVEHGLPDVAIFDYETGQFV